MELDLETFLTLLYVITDDLYDTVILPQLPKSGGPEPIRATQKCCAWVWRRNGAQVWPGKPSAALCVMR